MILLIDDDPLIGHLVERLFIPLGYRVIRAYSGKEAISFLNDGLLPSVILLDLVLPDFSGNEFLECLIEAGSDIPVIVLSSYIDELRHDLQYRVSGVVSKPVLAQGLIESVARLCPPDNLPKPAEELSAPVPRV